MKWNNIDYKFLCGCKEKCHTTKIGYWGHCGLCDELYEDDNKVNRCMLTEQTVKVYSTKEEHEALQKQGFRSRSSVG